MGADGQRSDSPGSDGHHDLDTLADADAAVLDPLAAREVLAHASGCTLCGTVLDALRAVRADLAAAPPPQLSASVAARLDAALDAERRARFGPLTALPPHDSQTWADRPTPPTEPATQVTVVPFDPAAVPSGRGGRNRTDRPRRSRWLGWAAAAVVLIGGGGGVTLGLRASAPHHRDLASSPTFTPSATDTVRGSVVESQPGAGILPHQGGGDTASGVPSYTRRDIEDNLAAILARAYCDGGSCASGPAGVMSDSERRSRCTSELNGSGVPGKPKAVQFAFFEGAPAFVFVFDDNRIVVVGDDCGRSSHPNILFSDH